MKCNAVVNLGGPDAAVATMQSKEEDFICNTRFRCCCSCCLVHKDKVKFYRTATWWAWHAWWTRIAVIVIATIGYYAGSQIVYIVFSLVAAAILIGAAIILINFCKSICIYVCVHCCLLDHRLLLSSSHYTYTHMYI